MKKILTLSIMATILLTSLTACSDRNNNTKTTDNVSSATETSSSTAEATEAKKNAYETLTLDTKDGFIITMEYPSDQFTVEESINTRFFKLDEIKSFDWLSGHFDKETKLSSSICFQYGEVDDYMYHSKFSEYLENFLKDPKGHYGDKLNIHEEKKFGDYNGFRYQLDHYSLYIYIALTESRCLECMYSLGCSAKGEDYLNLVNSEAFNRMLDSIKITRQS